MSSAQIFRRPHLQLVASTPSKDTIAALEVLLEGARAGDINGLAFVATLPGMRYITNAAGFCHDHPTFTCGAASILINQLGCIAQERDPDELR